METDTGVPPRQPSVPPPSPRGALLLWLAAAALVLLSLPLLAMFDALQTDLGRLQVAIIEEQSARVSPVSSEEMAALRATATAVAATEASLQAILTQAGGGGVPWVEVLEPMLPVPPAPVRLTSLRQDQDRLILHGVATDPLALAAYEMHLRNSPLFDKVHVVSGVEPTTTATPAPSMTPTAVPTRAATLSSAATEAVARELPAIAGEQGEIEGRAAAEQPILFLINLHLKGYKP